MTKIKFIMKVYIYRQKMTSSVIKQKEKSQNGGNKKTKHAKFSEKWLFLIPDTHAYVGIME